LHVLSVPSGANKAAAALAEGILAIPAARCETIMVDGSRWKPGRRASPGKQPLPVLQRSPRFAGLVVDLYQPVDLAGDLTTHVRIVRLAAEPLMQLGLVDGVVDVAGGPSSRPLVRN